MNRANQPDFLQASALKLVFFGGKGGVGKSTCALTAALKLARQQPQQRFLLVSTDPAHSLRHILADLALPENLLVRELDAAASLHDFKAKYDALLQEIANRGTFLDAEDIHGLMDAAMPGMDELAAYFELADWLQQDQYQRIIVDTAPTGHTLRLLEMPTLIHRWLSALDTLLAKHRYMRRRFAGNHQRDHLDQFLLDMNQQLQAMQQVITDKQRCRFVLVMQAERMSVEESLDLLKALQTLQIAVAEIVVNPLQAENHCEACIAERNRQIIALQEALKRIPSLSFWSLPLLVAEPRGELLLDFWQQAQRLSMSKLTIKTGHQRLSSQVINPQPLPSQDLRLLIFAGKGGVGKTTMACATALQLQHQYPDLRLLLFSTDPAHSLSDCLKLKLQALPTQVMGDLDGQEVNAEAEFDSVRRNFRQELAEFLQQALPQIDISFDREVMEHLLDLAPPGLDEIIALTLIIEHIDQGRYDMIIVDAAPSGHLLRLLEMPALIRDWLRLFFALLLKYRQVLRLPNLSARLVALSRGLKKLHSLLQNPQQTRLYAVTIATELAVEKTIEMLDSLQNLGIDCHALLINQLTAVNQCRFCQARVAREALALKTGLGLFTELPQIKIFRQTDPAGISMLTALGEAMFLSQK